MDLYRIFKRPDFFKVEKVRLTINESETEKKFKTSLLIEYFEKVDEIIREYGESCDKNLELLIESMESGIYRQMVEVYTKFKILEDEEKLLSELLILYKKLNSEKSRSKNLLAQQQYGITHDFTTRERLDQQITA